MKNELSNLVEISRYYGNNPEYVIAGGGNTSYKNEHYLWIKASGTSLASITEGGFAKMDRSCLARIAQKSYNRDPLKREAEIIKELFKCVADNSGLRPSVETSLHNLLNFSFVVHTHPTLVNGLMCSKNSGKVTREIFSDDALLVEYTDPGYILFKLVEKRIAEFVKKCGKEPQIIFLENHGVFVSANTIVEVRNLYTKITERIKYKIASGFPSPELTKQDHSVLKELSSINKNHLARYFQSPLIEEFTRNKKSFAMAGTAFSPDNIVYCKAHYLFTRPEPDILKRDYLGFKNKYGYFPKVVALENSGIICLEENENSLNTVYEVFLDILKISFYTRNFGGPRFMTPEQIEFIDNWEVENYRREVAKKGDGVTT
jgi:rhamnose utilization protein RhaD (predicted bifunctional aldolase and dehydrogenase)